MTMTDFPLLTTDYKWFGVVSPSISRDFLVPRLKNNKQLPTRNNEEEKGLTWRQGGNISFLVVRWEEKGILFRRWDYSVVEIISSLGRELQTQRLWETTGNETDM